jgi:hypothetical protein
MNLWQVYIHGGGVIVGRPGGRAVLDWSGFLSRETKAPASSGAFLCRDSNRACISFRGAGGLLPNAECRVLPCQHGTHRRQKLSIQYLAERVAADEAVGFDGSVHDGRSRMIGERSQGAIDVDGRGIFRLCPDNVQMRCL